MTTVRAIFNVRRKDIIGAKRGRSARNEARLLSIYLLARHSMMAQREIGKLFGGVSDVAVSRAAKQCGELLKTDKNLKNVYAEMMGLLKIC